MLGEHGSFRILIIIYAIISFIVFPLADFPRSRISQILYSGVTMEMFIITILRWGIKIHLWLITLAIGPLLAPIGYLFLYLHYKKLEREAICMINQNQCIVPSFFTE